MNLPTAIRTIRWLIFDTFRQSLATRLFWVMMALNFLVILFCLSVRVTGDDMLPLAPGEVPMRLNLSIATQMGREKALPLGVVGGAMSVETIAEPLGKQIAKKEGLDVFETQLSLGFGLIEIPKSKDRKDAVRFLQVWLAGAVADTIGIFLVLIWTAGFLPTFLEPNQLTVLLAKPIPRWSLFLGKYLGVLFFVGMQGAIFVIGTWLALGIRTGVFDALYLLTIPLLVIHFSIFYSFSALLAVSTRNTVVCVFGGLLFWSVCWGMNFARHAMVAYDSPGLRPTSKIVMEVGYWTLPKPGDMGLILFDSLQADGFSLKVPEFKKVQTMGKFQPELSVLSSFLFAAILLGIAAREFKYLDY